MSRARDLAKLYGATTPGSDAVTNEAGTVAGATVSDALDGLKADVDGKLAADGNADTATFAATAGSAAIADNATEWGGAAYTVSTSGPSGGDDGDFWFEREA